jgi:hypothetical protein
VSVETCVEMVEPALSRYVIEAFQVSVSGKRQDMDDACGSGLVVMVKDNQLSDQPSSAKGSVCCPQRGNRLFVPVRVHL